MGRVQCILLCTFMAEMLDVILTLTYNQLLVQSHDENDSMAGSEARKLASSPHILAAQRAAATQYTLSLPQTVLNSQIPTLSLQVRGVGCSAHHQRKGAEALGNCTHLIICFACGRTRICKMMCLCISLPTSFRRCRFHEHDVLNKILHNCGAKRFNQGP